MKDELLRLCRLSLSSQGRPLLENLNLSLLQGELHGLFCRSDRCRSALFELLGGRAFPEGGMLLLFGREVPSPAAWRQAAGELLCRLQDDQLFLQLTVAENICGLQERFFSHRCLDLPAMYAEAQRLLKEVGLPFVRADQLLGEIPPWQRQLVALLQTLARGSKILVLEDSAGSYTRAQAVLYKNVLRCLRRAGVSVLFITDRFSELILECDRLSVLRHGTIVSVSEPQRLKSGELLSLFRGDGSAPPREETSPSGDDVPSDVRPVRLELQSVSAGERLRGFSLSLFAGEALGVYDPDWTICEELSRMLTGQLAYTGFAALDGRPLPSKQGARPGVRGIALLDESSGTQGIFHNLGLFDNVGLLLDLKHPLGIENSRMTYYTVLQALGALDLLGLVEEYGGCERLPQLGGSLQLSLVIARWLCTGPAVMIFRNPHIGYNDLSLHEFGETLGRLKRRGISILLLSRSRSQLRRLCSRIIEVEEEPCAEGLSPSPPDESMLY